VTLPREVAYETRGHRIADRDDHDRDRGRRLLGRDGRLRHDTRDHGRLQSHELGGKRREPRKVVVRGAALDDDIPAIHVAELLQPAQEPGLGGARARHEQSDARNAARLLRASDERRTRSDERSGTHERPPVDRGQREIYSHASE
jgi:hypothetical protein